MLHLIFRHNIQRNGEYMLQIPGGGGEGAVTGGGEEGEGQEDLGWEEV